MIRTKRILYQLTQRGLTSELNNLLLAYLYALEKNLEFELSSRFWGAAYSQGWQDYFEPFCPERQSRLARIGTVVRLPRRIALRQFIYKSLRPGTLLTHDLWKSMHSSEFLDKNFNIPSFGIDGGCYHAKRQLLKQIYRLNTRTRDAVESACVSIHPPYTALHIRRGDKLISEASQFDIHLYIEAIKKNAPDCQRIFIASDDYACVQECKSLYPEYEILSLTQPAMCGYQQNQHNIASADVKKQHTLSMLADLHCMAQAEHFVGTFSSNVGRFIALMIGIEKCTSLDDRWHAA